MFWPLVRFARFFLLTLRPGGGGLTLIFVAHELLSTRRCAAAAHMEENRPRSGFGGSYDPALV